MTEYQNIADQPQPQLLAIADRAKAVNVAFASWIAIVVLTGLYELAFLIPAYSELAGQPDTEDASTERLVQLSGQSLAVGGIGLLVNLAAGITYLVWLYRARDNAERLSTWHHRRSRAWLFWGWIVPVVSFWFPYQIVADIRSASLRGSGDADARPSVNLLNWWWGLYVLNTFGSVAILYFNNTSAYASIAEVAASIRTTLTIGLLQLPIGIAAAVLAIRVVQGITELQTGRRPGSPLP